MFKAKAMIFTHDHNVDERVTGLPHPGKVLDFLLWKVLENIWEVSRSSRGQNSEATFFKNKHKKIGT